MIYFNYFADWNFPGVVMMEFQFLTERGTEVYTHADPLCIHDMFGAKRFAKKAKCFWKADTKSFNLLSLLSIVVSSPMLFPNNA